MKTKNLLTILAFFAIWRTVLFVIAYFSPRIIQTFGARFPYYQERLISSGLPHFVWSFGNFDGVHYLGIAKDGYAYQFTQAFFPLYPILVKLVNYIVGNLVISGLLVSNVAFLFGLVIFFKLICDKFSEKTAFWSTIFLLTFPTSFYFGAIYTEGLFFLLIIGYFYMLEKNRILISSFLGAFASATRLVGVFLGFAQLKHKSFLPTLLIPSGLLVYMFYLQQKFHNPFYFLTAQSIFGQGRSNTEIVLLPQVFWRYAKILTTTHGLAFTNAAFELISTLLGFTLLFIAFKKKLKAEWLIFSFLAILTPTLTGTLTSMPRYILIAFPIYIVLAQIKSNLAKLLVVSVFTLLLAVVTVFFTQGYWVA